jgi:hypothetical protein
MEATLGAPATRDALARAADLEARGDYRGAIDALTTANRAQRDSQLEVALVRLRRDSGLAMPKTPAVPRTLPIHAEGPGADALFSVTADELDVDAVRHGWSHTGALHVRGLVPPDLIADLTAGIDSALAAYDAADDGRLSDVDPGWYTPFSMPSRKGDDGKDGRIDEAVRRKWVRKSGGLWTANSPRMVFNLFELVDELKLGQLMTDFLGARPVLSANKCTLRRVEPEDAPGGWHQDGAFLGQYAGSFNIWIALTTCGVDAPGMDMVPRRFDEVLASGDDAPFDWSLSDAAVLRAADGVPIVRPEFQAGDAVFFDHLCLHRTAATSDMVRPRHAIEAWFFTPEHYPEGQLPLAY